MDKSHIIKTTTNDQSRLSNDFLPRGNSTTNEPAPEKEPVDLNELLKDIEEINDLVIFDSECTLFFLYSNQKTLDEKYIESLKEETK